MIDNFAALKQQLHELAAVLNEFKSETLQLKILEYVLSGDFVRGEVPDTNPADKKKSAAKKRSGTAAKKTSANDSGKPKKSRSSAGAVALLTGLVAGDFFKKSRTINDIVEDFRVNQARTIKPNEISGKLGRLVRNGELKRKKNADNQFEYSKP